MMFKQGAVLAVLVLNAGYWYGCERTLIMPWWLLAIVACLAGQTMYCGHQAGIANKLPVVGQPGALRGALLALANMACTYTAMLLFIVLGASAVMRVTIEVYGVSTSRLHSVWHAANAILSLAVGIVLWRASRRVADDKALRRLNLALAWFFLVVAISSGYRAFELIHSYPIWVN